MGLKYKIFVRLKITTFPLFIRVWKDFGFKKDENVSSAKMTLVNEFNVNVNMELDKNVNLGIGQFVPILFSLIDIIILSFLKDR